MDNRELRHAVEQALDWEPMIDATGIGVAADDGVVTLTGHVPNFAEKREAEKAAGSVRGVRAVVCDLKVTLLAHHERTDEDIAHTAANALAWNTVLPKGKVQVWVDHGRITLEGTVDWQYQRKAADRCVRYLAGVKDVNNHVIVKPAADSVAVKTQIEAALLRNAKLDAAGIHVAVRGDRVILSGNVQSWVERNETERAAWASPGVRSVENLLLVTPVETLVVQ